MKTLLLLLSLPLLLLTSNANGYHSQIKLNLEIEDRIPVTVKIGNQIYGPATSFQIFAQPGRHHVKIERIRSSRYGNVIQTVYSGNINLRPQTEVYAMLSRFMQMRITEKQFHHVPSWGAYPAGGACNHHAYQDTYYYDGYPVYYEAPQPVIKPMSAPAFNALVSTINNQWFDSTKKEVAVQALSNNYITAAQAKRLIRLFTFESTKVEIAKFAYHSVVDPENYYVIYDGFTFSSSISEISRYIAMN